MAAELIDLEIHINGDHMFFLNQRIISAYSIKLKKMIKQAKKNTQMRKTPILIEFDRFPGGPDGFELITRFCYNYGDIFISTSNVSVLHCAAIFLEITASKRSLVLQIDSFLEGMFEWSWNDVVICLKSCESVFEEADSCGLIDKLIFSLLAKIAQNTDNTITGCSSSSSSSSPENEGVDGKNGNVCSVYYNGNVMGKNRAWWFDDLSNLPPKIIEKMIKSLGAYGSDNNSLVLTRFLLHYLKIAGGALFQNRGLSLNHSLYSGLADTAVYGVMLMGKTAFSCRGLFWVLRTVTNFRLSESCRSGLEKLIGSMVDQAKLDDLLVCRRDGVTGAGGCSGRGGGVYDVSLVGRLVRVFVGSEGVSVERLRKVGWLMDQYLGEISPDMNLKVSKFMGVALSLPDVARDCFDGVYRAIDLYLESHPNVSWEERSRLCRCLNFEKLSLEACKDLAKNPRIPPRIAVEALAAQPAPKDYNYESNSCESPTTTVTTITGTTTTCSIRNLSYKNTTSKGNGNEIVVYNGAKDVESIEEEKEGLRINIEKMQWRVMELEKMCRVMKGQMSKLVMRQRTLPNRPSPKLC
ncbi:hypothetical protein Drorol1_Dr00019637 [Drosera rotundifolia]